jgi:hypothetical protein
MAGKLDMGLGETGGGGETEEGEGRGGRTYLSVSESAVL